MPVKKIEKIYVGIFEIDTPDGNKSEIIYSGFYVDENGYTWTRATMEHEEAAVPGLVNFCDSISKEKDIPWRLILFDKSGITELDPVFYRDIYSMFNFSTMQ